jgi:hypothetical protein
MKLEATNASPKGPLLHSGLLRHVCAATNMYTTVKEMLGVVSSNQSDIKLYKESQQDPEPELSDSKIWS